MANFSDILNAYAQQGYGSAADQEANGITQYNMAAPTGAVLDSNQVANLLGQLQGYGQFYQDLGATNNRSIPETIADTGVSAIQGLESVATIPAAVIGASQDLVNLGLNAAFDTNYPVNHTSRYLQGVNNLIDATGQALQSDKMLQRKRAMSSISDAHAKDNVRRYKDDIANGKNTLEASLSYIGRGILNSASETSELPEILDVAGQAVGQIVGQSATINLARAAIKQGLDVAANGIKNASTRHFMRSQIGRDKATSATGSLVAPNKTDTALNMAAIGLTEAGGQAANTADVIDAIPTKDLYTQSPEFVSLVQENLDRGMSLELAEARARDSLKNEATLKSLMYATPAALIASRAGSRLVDNPLGRAIPTINTRAGTRLRDNVVDVLGETTEEASTGFGTGVASQLAAQETYDKNAMLLEGAGENIGSGLAQGLYGAGAIRSPSLIRDTIGTAGSTIARAVTEGTRTVTQSELGEAAVNAAKIAGKATADTIGKGVKAVNSYAVRRDIKKNSNLYDHIDISDSNLELAGVSRTREDGSVKSSAELLSDIDAEIQKNNTPVTSQIKAAQAEIQIFNENQRKIAEFEKRDDLTAEQQQQLASLKAVFNRNNIVTLRNDALGVINDALNSLSKDVKDVATNKATEKQLKELKEKFSDNSFIQVLTTDLNTAEQHQETIKNTVAYAQKIGLNDQQIAALKAIDSTINAYKSLRQNQDLNNNIDEITDNLISSENEANYKTGKLSIKQILQDMYAMRNTKEFAAGDESALDNYEQSLNRLEDLYTVMTNKLEALYKSRKTPNGAKVKYQTINPLTRVGYEEDVYYNRHAPESARMFRGLIKAQKDIRAIYNNFSLANAEDTTKALRDSTPYFIDEKDLFENKYSDAKEILKELDAVIANKSKATTSSAKKEATKAKQRTRKETNKKQESAPTKVTAQSVIDKAKKYHGKKNNRYLMVYIRLVAIGNEKGKDSLSKKDKDAYDQAYGFIKKKRIFTQEEKDILLNMKSSELNKLLNQENKIEDRVIASESEVDSIAQAADDFVNRYLDGKSEIDSAKFRKLESNYKAESKKLDNKSKVALWNGVSKYFKNKWFKESPKDSIYKQGMSQTEVFRKVYDRVVTKIDSYLKNSAYSEEDKVKLTNLKENLNKYLSTSDTESPLVQMATTIAKVFNEGFKTKLSSIQDGTLTVGSAFLSNETSVGVFGEIRTDTKGDLAVSLDDSILGVTAITALEILNELPNYMGNKDTSNIEQEYGINSSDIKPDDLNILLSGSRADTIIAAINKRLADNLGITLDNDISLSFNGTKPITGLSLLIMQSLKELGVINKHTISIERPSELEEDDSDKSNEEKSPHRVSTLKYTVVTLNNDIPNEYYSKAKLSGLNKTVFIKAIAPTEDNREFFMDEPMPNIDSIHKINSPTSYTKAEKTAIENQRKTKHYLNMPFYHLIQNLGIEGLTKLFGNGIDNKIKGLSNNDEVADTEAEFFNRNVYASIEGKNRTLFYGYAANMERAQIAQDLAGEGNIPYIRIDYRMTRNGRYQETLPFGPGADKVARQMFSHVREQLDLNNETENYIFSLALAQAFDVKVKDISNRQAIIDLGNQIRRVIAANLKNQEQVLEGNLDISDLRNIFNAIGNIKVDYIDSQGKERTVSPKSDITALALNGLLNAIKANIGNGKFLNTLSLEIDATSAGISNLITMFDSNPDFTISQLIGMWNGGHMVGNAISYPTYRDMNHQDNYERAAELASANQEKFLQENVAEDSKQAIGNLLRSILKVVSLAGLDISYNDTYFSSGSNLNLKIPRSITKEIVTRMAYEQGLNSATTEFLVRIGDFIHQHMSYALQANNLLAKDANPNNPFKEAKVRKENIGALFFYNELENIDPETQAEEYAAKVDELNSKFEDFITSLDTIYNSVLSSGKDNKVFVNFNKSTSRNFFRDKLTDIRNYKDFNFVKQSLYNYESNAVSGLHDNFKRLFMTSIFNAVNQIKGKGVINTNATITGITNVIAIAHEYEILKKYRDFIEKHGYEPSPAKIREWNFGADQSLKLTFNYDNITRVNVDKTRAFPVNTESRRVRSLVGGEDSWNFQGSFYTVGPVNVSPVPVITHAITDGIIQTKSFDKIDNGSGVNRYDGTETSLKDASSNTQIANKAAHDITRINPLKPIKDKLDENKDKLVDLLTNLQDELNTLNKQIREDEKSLGKASSYDLQVRDYLETLQNRINGVYYKYLRNYKQNVKPGDNTLTPYYISSKDANNLLDHKNMLDMMLTEAIVESNNIDKKQAAIQAAPTYTAHMVADNSGFDYGTIDTAKVTKYSSDSNNINERAKHVASVLNQEKLGPTPIVTTEPTKLSINSVLSRFSSGSRLDKFLNEFVLNNLPKDYTIYSGTSEEIRLFAKSKYNVDFPANARGACLTDKKVIFVVNGSKTDLAHEIIHAVTKDKIERFSRMSSEEAKALTGKEATAYKAFNVLNGLLDQFQDMQEDIERINTESDTFDMTDYISMQRSLQNLHTYLFEDLEDNRSAQLYEFMAYAMTNPDIRRFLDNKSINKNTLSYIQETLYDKLKQFYSFFKTVARMAATVLHIPTEGLDNTVNEDTLNFLAVLEVSTATLSENLPENTTNSVGNNIALSINFDDDSRLNKVISNIKSAVDSALHARKFEQFKEYNDKTVQFLQKTFMDDADEKISRFNSLIDEAVKAGFSMTAKQMQAAKTIMSVFNTGIGINPILKVEAENLRKVILDKLSSEDFLATSANEIQAQAKYDYLANTFGYVVKGMNNAPSTLATYLKNNRDASLSIFMGLALTNPELRDILEKTDIDSSIYEKASKVVNSANSKADELINSLGSKVVDLITASITNRPKFGSARKVIDNYIDSIQALNKEYAILNLPNSVISAGDTVIKNNLNKLLRKLVESDTFKNQINDPNNNRVKAILLHSLASGIDLWSADPEVITADIRRNINNFAIKHPGVIARFLTTSWKELFAADTDYDELQAIQKKNKAETQVKRQVYRETLPRIILEQFSDAGINLSKEDKQALNTIINKCDLGALSEQEIWDVFKSNSGMDNLINRLENQIDSLVSTQDMRDKILKKSKQLANYMNSGIPGANLLRNADAIAHLLNIAHKGRVYDMDALIENIDKLVTVYALSDSNPKQFTAAKDIFKKADKAMLYTISQQRNLRTNEMKEARDSYRGRYNYYKGYTPYSNKNGAQVLVIDPADLEKYESMGYKKLGKYEGPRIENTKPLIYVANDVNPMMSFSQGALQTTINLVGGVDPNTGISSQLTAGRITNPYIVGQYRNRMEQDTGIESFIPVFDANGKLIALERSINPVYMNAIKSETNFAQVLGNWSGRQIEESMSEELNTSLIHKLKEMFDNASFRDKANFVNLIELARKDPVIRDALNTLSAKTKRTIYDTFGNSFMVRQDMIDDIIGHRRASIVDSFTGNSRLSPTTQAFIRNAAMAIMGKHAFRRLYMGERILMNAVAGARNWIVVRSLSVMLDNNLSNIVQLNMRGIPFTTILREIPQLLKETESYNLYRQKRAKLEADLNAAKGEGKLNQYKINAIENKLKALDESISNLSIKPLLDAGEYNTISDIGDTEDDLNLSMGKWGEWIENKVDALPKGIREAGKYALISKDTSLYRALEKSVQYGDFIAKAIYYKHLTQQGMQHKQAMSKVRYEFVNYDMLAGRSREFLENIGLLWFYNYKLRTARIMFSMLKDNPLHALMFLGMPAITSDIGSPVTDNILSKVIGGGITGSIGYGLMLDSPGNLLWFNLVP